MPNIFANLPVICAILANSFAVGFSLIVVSAKNKGPCFVNIRLQAAILVTSLSFSINSNIGFTTVG